jgi:LmbE family N-acetylglucosaminyl deacetylase
MIYYLIFGLFLAYCFLVFKRAKKYRYDTRKDYAYNLEKHQLAKLSITETKTQLPANIESYDTLFLKVTLSFFPLSYFFKPYIQIDEQKHFFEYGAQGTRYLNISGIAHNTPQIKSKNLRLRSKSMTLYGYQNAIKESQKVLILAPHADDAEIAAFGFYKTMQNVTIVTTTAAEHGICNYCELYKKDRTKNSIKKAELRIFDALCIPMLGNVPMHNTLALGYFGGSLKWMRENPGGLASSLVTEIEDMNKFRRVAHADIKLKENTQSKYEAFLEDLTQILQQLQPSLIVTAHPIIDSHPDHKYTTIAAMQAVKELNYKCKFLLYTNHLELSETYPIGKIHSSITLPPNKDDVYFDSIYSFNLNQDLQIDKFFALEAMHDLRNSLVFLSAKYAWKHFNKMLKREITGKDKSYFKRAMRANELFFVVESENTEKLLEI